MTLIASSNLTVHISKPKKKKKHKINSINNNILCTYLCYDDIPIVSIKIKKIYNAIHSLRMYFLNFFM